MRATSKIALRNALIFALTHNNPIYIDIYPPITSIEKKKSHRKRPAQEFYLLISVILHGRKQIVRWSQIKNPSAFRDTIYSYILP